MNEKTMTLTRMEAPAQLPVRKRVAAYARVSMEKDAMLHSLAAQVSYYSERIQRNPEWEYAGVFADFGLTGTKETRPEFQRMLQECREGKIDLILVKSISRFARNTLTLLNTVRELKGLGIGVYFEEQKLDTLSGDGEFILRDRKGLDFPTDGITISTTGPLPQMKKLREEHLKIQLTLSLHATNQHVRDYIMPHMKGYDINEVVQSVLSYSERHNRSVTIAYLLIPGVNDRANDVKQLGRWFRDKNVLINLLQYNETDCKAVRRPNKQELVAFRDKLNKVGLTVKIRESRGGNIKAACGQLVSRLNNRNMSAPKKKGASELDTGSSNNAGSSSRLKPSKRRYVNNKSKNGKKGSSHK